METTILCYSDMIIAALFAHMFVYRLLAAINDLVHVVKDNCLRQGVLKDLIHSQKGLMSSEISKTIVSIM